MMPPDLAGFGIIMEKVFSQGEGVVVVVVKVLPAFSLSIAVDGAGAHRTSNRVPDCQFLPIERQEKLGTPALSVDLRE
jgi:hypothetical protein